MADAEAAADMRQPLLDGEGEEQGRRGSLELPRGAHEEPVGSLVGPVVNLSCTIIGSGIIALPKSFEVLGMLLGAAVMLGVGLLSYFSIAGLVRATLKTRARSYSSVVRTFFGHSGSNVLRVTMILNCAGILIVYMVMVCDILVGSVSDGFEGVLPSLFGIHEPGHIVTSRGTVLGFVLVFILGPVASMREMKSVSITSTIGLISVIYLVISIILIAIAASAEHQLSPDWSWLPQLDALGKDTSDAMLQLVATIPVVMNAFICHQSVHPVMSQVRPLTQKRMDQVVIYSLMLCCTLYIFSAGCAYMVFGHKTKSDVLQNFTVSGMAALLPMPIALTLAYSVRLVFSVALMMAFPLSHFTYRDNLVELIWGHHAAELSLPKFYGITAAGLFLFYVAACTLPNIWLPLSIIGSTAGVTVAFAFPSALILAMDSHNVGRQLVGAVLLAAGLSVSLSGLTSTLLPMIQNAGHNGVLLVENVYTNLWTQA
mmetsp:Transcript_13536/g.34173  ORF Transcript_13536/g.34173 Transcript_13536/m.34173 type:complete len:485 (-) Transcript_13536:92-1546(-)|eukprot:jgi/Tetstr1/466411/TSEL_010939.t1